jgi:hypothetical protein
MLGAAGAQLAGGIVSVEPVSLEVDEPILDVRIDEICERTRTIISA